MHYMTKNLQNNQLAMFTKRENCIDFIHGIFSFTPRIMRQNKEKKNVGNLWHIFFLLLHHVIVCRTNIFSIIITNETIRIILLYYTKCTYVCRPISIAVKYIFAVVHCNISMWSEEKVPSEFISKPT